MREILKNIEIITDEELLKISGGMMKTFEDGGFLPINSGIGSGIYPRQ